MFQITIFFGIFQVTFWVFFWKFSKSLDIFDDAHAILVLTEWEDYKNIGWDNVVKKMVKPSWIFDARSIVNIDLVKKSGINLWRLGDGS